MPTLESRRGKFWRWAQKAGNSALLTSLIASWPMEEAGDAIDDYAPANLPSSSYDLVNADESGVSPGIPGIVCNATGEYLYTDYASAPNLYPATATPLTVAFTIQWLAAPATTSHQSPAVSLWNTNASKAGFLLCRQAESHGTNPEEMQFSVSHNGTDITTIYGPVIEIGTRYHIVARYDGSNLKLQVDGSDETPVAHTTGILRDQSIQFEVARYTPGNGTPLYGNLRIANLNVWNVALSDSDVALWYNSGNPKVVPFF